MSWTDRHIRTDPLRYVDGCFTMQGKSFNTTASTTSIVIPDLAGYGDDFFNNHYYMTCIKNADSAGAAPEGEYRLITDYVSASGTFTVDAFSATVASTDELLVMHELIYLIYIATSATIPDYVISDMDNFDVADADADNARWNPEYITGTEGGSADIDTTTSDRLMVKVDPDATPTEARYAVSHNLPFYADFFNVTTDLNVTWGATDSATAKAVGILVSKGATYDSQNYLAIERQKGTAINRVTVSGALNNVAISATNTNLTDDAVALKIERYDTVWRLYYSTAQYPAYDWTLVAQVEDPSDYMSGSVTYYQEAYSKGTADTESVQGDFGYFRYVIGSGGGGQYLVGDYDSTWVTRDENGNLFERTEDLREDLVGTNGVAAFPAAADIANGVSMAAAIRAILTSMVGGDDYDGYTNISNTANASINAIAQKFATVIGIDTTNTYSSTVQGAGRATIEATFDALATYIAASGAALSIQLNNQTARDNIEQVLEDYFTLVGVNGTNVLTNINNSANTTFNAVWQKFAALWGADGTNIFNPTIQGAAQTTLDTALAELAKYLAPSGAAISVTMNNGAAKTTIEEIWEAFLAVVGIDGTNVWSTSINGATQTTIEATEQAIGTAVQNLAALTDGSTVSLDTVVDKSIICKLATKDALGGDSSDFDNTTDSLEALSDKLGAFSGDGGAAQDDSVKASLDLAHTDLDTIITDTEKIYDVTLGTTPAAGSLASFIATGGTALGTSLPASTSIYDTTKNIRTVAIDGSSVPVTNTLSDILHKDGSYTYDNTTDSLEALADKLATGVGQYQFATTTEDLNQAAATYDLLTGTTQPVLLETLSFKMPNVDISGGSLTYITIQTDDTTAQVVFNSTDGALANLTQEAELSFVGAIRINVGTKLQLTIAGGAAGTACSATITAGYKAIVAGGTLA